MLIIRWKEYLWCYIQVQNLIILMHALIFILFGGNLWPGVNCSSKICFEEMKIKPQLFFWYFYWFCIQLRHSPGGYDLISSSDVSSEKFILWLKEKHGLSTNCGILLQSSRRSQFFWFRKFLLAQYLTEASFTEEINLLDELISLKHLQWVYAEEWLHISHMHLPPT